MSTVKQILLQLDSDPVASSFDAVVAVDAGTDVLVQYPNMRPEQVSGLVHGAMFTRSPAKLKHTAIFIGGSNVELAEQCYQAVVATFFGPLRVSVAMDANGCNTTSVAAVESALQALKRPELADCLGDGLTTAFVFGGTGPVGQRIARLAVELGWQVHLHSRSADKAAQVAAALQASTGSAAVCGTAAAGDALQELLVNCPVIFNASAAGVASIGQSLMEVVVQSPGAIVDLNAVPPSGVAGLSPRDQHKWLGRRLVSGALAVGDWKMKLHRAVIRACFTANDRCFNLREIATLSRELQAQSQ